MGKGKAKIEIKKIESLQVRNVCFTKRLKGLYKKEAELGRLFPEIRITAVVFSPAGNPYIFGDVWEMEKLLAMEESRNALLRSEETEKGEEENADSAPVVEVKASNPSTVTDSTPQKITESGDMASNPSMVTDFTMKEVTENKNARFCMCSRYHFCFFLLVVWRCPLSILISQQRVLMDWMRKGSSISFSIFDF